MHRARVVCRSGIGAGRMRSDRFVDHQFVLFGLRVAARQSLLSEQSSCRMIDRERSRRNENRSQLPAHLGQLILDTQRLADVFDTRDKAIIGKLAQVLRQNLLRNTSQVTLQLQCTYAWVGEEPEQYRQLPAPLDHAYDSRHVRS